MPFMRIRGRGQYAPLSAQYFLDEAIGDAGEAAELLYLRGLAFCAGSRSDGWMSARHVERFLGAGLGDLDERIKELLRVGLWQADESERGGYSIRSWVKWNRTTEEMDEMTARDAERKRSSRRGLSTTSTRDDESSPDGRPADGRSDSGRSHNGRRNAEQYRTEHDRTEQSNVRTDPGGSVGPDIPRAAPATPPDMSGVRERIAKSAKAMRNGKPTKAGAELRAVVEQIERNG